MAALWASDQLANTIPAPDEPTHPSHQQAAHDEEQENALAAFGLQSDPDQPTGPEPDHVYIWPECVPVWGVFFACQTQWRFVSGLAGGGRTGLDYTALQAVMGLLGTPRKDRAEVFALVQHMEQAALGEWAKKR